MKKYFLLILICFSSVLAQNIQVKSSVDSKKITIGDWIKLEIEAKHSKEINLIWPKLEDVIGKFEVVKRDSVPRIKSSNDEQIESLSATISIYDSGYYQIPPIQFLYFTNNDTSKKTVSTEPIDIIVSTIAVDTTLPIKDIKDVMDVPIPFMEIISYIAVIILIILLIYSFYLNYKNKKTNLSQIVETPLLPPHEQAYKELSELENKRLWQKGLIKEYYTEVTEIIRRYIERRYNIKAMEMTSSEILNSLITIHKDEEIQETLKIFLNLADFVKFAKYQPNTIDNEEELRRAYIFVDNTKLEVVDEINNSDEKTNN